MAEVKYLTQLYHDPSRAGSFSGPEKLYQAVKDEGKFKIGRLKIRNFLRDQEEFSVQKDIKRKRRRRKIVVSGVDTQWAIDLADVQNLSKFNNGIKYFLIVIDIFSKFLFVETLKDKKASTVLKGFIKILDKGRQPQTVFSDKGGEFNNALLKKELTKRNIKYFTTQNEDIKTSIAERVIRTLKNKLYRLFHKLGSYRYIETLQKVVEGYNKSKHKSLHNHAPADVTKNNEALIWDFMYNSEPKKLPAIASYQFSKSRAIFKFKIGSYVRLSYVRYNFQRDYQQKWTTELFKISERFMKENIPLYKVVDLNDSPITGSFYEFELSKVSKLFEYFKVQSILKTRNRKGKKEHLIKWQGYPDRFNSWVLASDVKGIDSRK